MRPDRPGGFDQTWPTILVAPSPDRQRRQHGAKCAASIRTGRRLRGRSSALRLRSPYQPPIPSPSLCDELAAEGQQLSLGFGDHRSRCKYRVHIPIRAASRYQYHSSANRVGSLVRRVGEIDAKNQRVTHHSPRTLSPSAESPLSAGWVLRISRTIHAAAVPSSPLHEYASFAHSRTSANFPSAADSSD